MSLGGKRAKPSKFERWFMRFVVLVAGLVLIGYAFRDFWFGQARIYYLGLIEVRSDQFGFRLPDVDEVEVMALGKMDYSLPDGPDRINRYAITSRKVLRGEGAEVVSKLWRSIGRGRGFSGMCHEPVYALRFFQGGKLIFETTVCWECHNFTIPLGFLGWAEQGFDAESEAAQQILGILKTQVPRPPEPDPTDTPPPPR